jgi:hypothetical protein
LLRVTRSGSEPVRPFENNAAIVPTHSFSVFGFRFDTATPGMRRGELLALHARRGSAVTSVGRPEHWAHFNGQDAQRSDLCVLPAGSWPSSDRACRMAAMVTRSPLEFSAPSDRCWWLGVDRPLAVRKPGLTRKPPSPVEDDKCIGLRSGSLSWPWSFTWSQVRRLPTG